MATGTIKRTLGSVIDSYTATYSIAANGGASVTLSTPAKTGYRKCSIIRLTTGDAQVVVRGWNLHEANDTAVIYAANPTTTAKSNITMSATILWIPN